MQRPQVTIHGNLTRDPELRFTNSGHAFATFGVAVNVRKKNAHGDWEDGEPEFHDVVCWRQLAESAAESLHKGMRVLIVGELNQRSWETDQGERRSKTEIAADEIGASIRFAKVTVERAERQTRAADAAPAARPVAEAAFEYDDEPF